MDAVRGLREEMKKNEEKRDQQHQELLDLIRGLQGSTSTSQPRSSGPRFDDPPFDDPPFDGRDQDFTPRDRTGSHQDGAEPQTRHHTTHFSDPDQQGPGGTGGTGTSPMDTEQIYNPSIRRGDPSGFTPAELTPTGDPSLLSSFGQRTSPAGDRRGQSPSLQGTLAADPQGQSPSSECHHSVDPSSVLPSRQSTGDDVVPRDAPLRSIPPDEQGGSSPSHRTDPSDLERTPPPLRRGHRIRRRGWRDRTPYTDPCRPKRPRMLPPPTHEWMPHALVDPEHLAAYMEYKRNPGTEL